MLRGSRYFASPRIAGLTVIVGIWIYALLVGAEATVVRAAIMAGLMIVAALHFLGQTG